MKNIKKILCLLSVLVLFSCTGDKDGKAKLLKKLVETSADGTAKTTLYKYKDNAIISIDGSQTRTDFTYTNGLISKMQTLDKITKGVTTLLYTYEEDRLVSVVSSDQYKISYVHNSDGTVSVEKWTLVSGNPDKKLYHGTLIFKDDNFIKETRTLDDAAPGVVATHSLSFEYDAKNNPFYFIKGFDKLLNQSNIISLNNSLISVVTSTETKDGQTISAANFYKNTITYDEEGYPKEKVSEAVMPENGNSEYLKSEYFY